MKKLLLGAAIALGAIFSANAQTPIMTQAFGTSSIPTGWSQNTPAVAADNWKFSNAFGSNMGNYVATQGYCAFVDDWDNNPSQTTANWDSLKGPSMNCSSYPNVWVSLNFMFWMDDGNETASIIVSTNGGATWTTAVNLPNTNGGWENGAIYDISSYAGGQANVMIGFTYYDGFATTTNGYVAVGMALQDVEVYAPANYDVQVASQNLPFLMQVGAPYYFSGTSNNLGADAITSMNMNYSVNGGTPVSQTISGISGFSDLTSYNWSMNTTPFTPPSAGIYKVKYWANNLDGGNANVNTDTLLATFWAIDSVKPRQAVYEEFTGQSCVFCMLAAPNMDSSYDNNAATSNIVRYHVPIPARDFMYVANETPINARESYYAITGAPAGYMDGTSLYPGADYGPESQRYSSTTIQDDNAIGSPIKIAITSAGYDAAKDSFFVSANITAYAAFAAGLKAQVALTVDSITYKYDLSMDDPQQEFAPPIGSGSSCCSYANCPDRYYPFVLKFTHVVEEMFPNSGSGTSLAAFTAGQSQTISFGWKKNHPWALYDHPTAQRDSDYYDSSATGQMVVFVQTNSAIAADGIPAQYVFQSASAPISGIAPTGLQQIANSGVSFQMYPNPANNSTNLAFKLDKDQNVNVEIYNMLGEQVYALNEGNMSAGQHTLMVNSSEFSSGVYMVRFTTDNASTTQKLVIQK